MISQILAGLFLLLWVVVGLVMHRESPSYGKRIDIAEIALSVFAGLLITAGISLVLGICGLLVATMLGVI